MILDFGSRLLKKLKVQLGHYCTAHERFTY